MNDLDLIPELETVLEANDPDQPNICPYAEIPEPQWLVKRFGPLPASLGTSIDVYASLFPLSMCIEQADQYGDRICLEDLTPTQYESAKRYWCFYRRMAEYYKRVDYFNDNPTEYYLWLVNSTKGSLSEELASHWDEVEPKQ